MSKLDELIKELCPDGVEYKTLGDIGKVRMCKRILKEQTSDDGDIPFYKIGTFGKEPNAYILRELFEEFKAKYSYPRVGEVLISASGTIGRTVIFDGQDAYFQDSNIVWIENDESQVLNKYLFHFYKIAKWYVAEGGTIQRLYNENLEKTPIPLPPLPIQEEIVRILDSFTELTAELTAEFTARKKQYEYYRDRLLTFGDEVEWKTLGDVLKIKNGKDYKHFKEGDIPVYGSGGIMTYIDTYVLDKASVLIPRKGSIGKLYYTDTPFWTVDTLFYTDIYTNTVVPKFVYYFLQKEHLEQYNTAGGVPSLTQTVLNRLPFPIPPLAEQQRIVNILDRFDTLCNDISSGLPAEIEARKKQYEYYRDKLLTFKDVNVEV